MCLQDAMNFTHICLLQVVLFQQSAMSFGGFLSFGGMNLGEAMVLDNSFPSIFKSLFKDMFECHENGIIKELKSVWNMVLVLSVSLLLTVSVSSIYVGACGSIKRMHCRG